MMHTQTSLEALFGGLTQENAFISSNQSGYPRRRYDRHQESAGQISRCRVLGPNVRPPSRLSGPIPQGGKDSSCVFADGENTYMMRTAR